MNRYKKLGNEIKKSTPAFLLILPTILVFVIFLYIPFINALRISTYEYNGLGELTQFVGISNYLEILKDELFYHAFFNNFKLIFFDLIFSISIGFFLAYSLYKGMPLQKFLNASLFIPYLISMVVVGCIWRIIYDPFIGPINQFLDLIGLSSIAKPWLSETNTALPAIIITWIWRTIPFNMLIIYTTLLSLPKELVEASMIDGANEWQKFIYIVVPFLVPTVLVLAILTITNDLRAFDIVWVMTEGGPGGASEVLPSYIYKKAFGTQKFGEATAASVIMMIALVLITGLFNVIRTKRDKK